MKSLKQLLEQTRAGMSVGIDDVYTYHQSNGEQTLCVALQSALDAARKGKRVEAGEYFAQCEKFVEPGDTRFRVNISKNARLVDWCANNITPDTTMIFLVFATDYDEEETREFQIIKTGEAIPSDGYYIGYVGGNILVEVAQ